MLHILTQDFHHTNEFPDIAQGLEAVEEFLPKMAEVMPSPAPLGRWVLLLEPSLPSHWQLLPWESLTLMGRPLTSQALVVRCAKWEVDQGNAAKFASFYNLFPSTEFSFTQHLQPAIKSRALRKINLASLRKDVRALSDVLIMAHGRDAGLVDASGEIFNLPITHPMPERIWLLACNVNGAMHELARRLLGHGCKTVVAATGDLAAPEIAHLLEKLFVDNSVSGETLSWLVRFEDALNNGVEGLGLTIWGIVDIDTSPCAKWNRLTWDNEHGVIQHAPLDDETNKDDFFSAQAQAMSPQAWPFTRKWMLPPLLWLAEIHDHPSMRSLSKLVVHSTTPMAIRGLAAIARRVGNYVQTAKYLSITLELPDLPVEEQANCLGALANLFIDLNLPESAIRVIELHDSCNLSSIRDRDEADFKRLDWMARAQARRGRLDIALDHMTAKRKMASTDTGRELAWQLYLSSWGQIVRQTPPRIAAAFADEVAYFLNPLSPHGVGFGNETTAYLVRALAAHSWACGDSKHFDILGIWVEYAESRLTDDDPGPWAYTITYMFLQHAVSAAMFERALSSLERARYYFEAASLSGLANRQTLRFDFLNRFQSRRRDILNSLKINKDINAAETLSETNLRTTTENTSRLTRENAAQHGNLPL